MKDFLKERGEMLVLSVFSPSYMTPRDFANQRGDRNEAEPRGFPASSGHRGCICCSLDLSSSCTVKFHLSIHPLRFFFSFCILVLFLLIPPAANSLSFNNLHLHFHLSYLTRLHSADFLTALSHKLAICSEV